MTAPSVVFPKTLRSEESRTDLDALADIATENKVVAADVNELLQIKQSIGNAIKTGEAIARISGATEECVLTQLVGMLGTVADGLPEVTRDMGSRSELQNTFDKSIARLGVKSDGTFQGLTIALGVTVASGDAMYVLNQGLVSYASGDFATNAPLSFGASGELVTWNGGNLSGSKTAPIGFAINANTAYVNTNSAWTADGDTLEFYSDSGVVRLRVKNSSDQQFGTVTLNTLNVLSAIQMNGKQFVDLNLDVDSHDLSISGILSFTGGAKVSATGSAFTISGGPPGTTAAGLQAWYPISIDAETWFLFLKKSP